MSFDYKFSVNVVYMTLEAIRTFEITVGYSCLCIY